MASKEVFEFGTGGSTLFLAQRCKHITSVEQDFAWYDQLKKTLTGRKIENSDLLLRPFDFARSQGFEDSTYLCALDRDYDLIVIDGYDHSRKARPICFQRAERFIRPGGIIVIDDAWAYQQLWVQSQAKRVEVFESCGPCRIGVTSTALFFY